MPPFGEGHVHPRALEIDHHGRQYGKGALIRRYHVGMLRRAVVLSGVRPGMSVLDYGCGHQMLAKQLPRGVDYVGYDLLPELTDVEDPRAQRYDIVFCIQVAQYLHEEGLRDLFAMFAEVANRCVLMIPHQGRFKRLLDRVFRQSADAETTFLTGFEGIRTAADRHFHLVRRNLHLGVADFSIWDRKVVEGARR